MTGMTGYLCDNNAFIQDLSLRKNLIDLLLKN